MNRSQLKKLYDQYLSNIYRFVYYRVGSRHDIAEDLTSDIFFKAVQNMATLDAEKHPVAWLYTVARNRLKMHYRDERPTESLDSITVNMDDVGINVDLANSLEQLSPEDRRLIEMKYLEGWSYKDMAKILDKRAQALRVQIHRIMKQLKREHQSYEVAKETI